MTPTTRVYALAAAATLALTALSVAGVAATDGDSWTHHHGPLSWQDDREGDCRMPSGPGLRWRDGRPGPRNP